ncbi:MAG: Spy/CpxP family protein refolding chaperone [Cellvibrionales bacterium]|nr:Spy/CpxP family protein refolding chaperone [Cellvibrionales bacterium]
MKAIYSCFTALIFLSLAQASVACDKKLHGSQHAHAAISTPNSCPCKLRGHLEELDLTKDQIKAIKAIKKETREKMQALKKEKRSMPSIRKLNPLKDDYIDKVKGIAEKSGEMTQAFVTLIAEQRIDIYKVLNKEQQKQLLWLEKKPSKKQGILKKNDKRQCKGKKKHDNELSPKNPLGTLPKKCEGFKQCDEPMECATIH